MSMPIDTSGWGPLSLMVGGVLLLALLLTGGHLLAILPESRARRELAGRLTPVIGMLVVLAYLLFAARQLFATHPDSVPFALALLLFGFGAAAWFAIRDIIAGVFIKAGRLCHVGDHVQVGELRGRIARMGYRVLSIETGQGEEAIVPYSALVRSSLLRTPVLQGAALHVFRAEVPRDLAFADVKRRVRESALTCHWASVVRQPQISLVAPHTIEVAVYALDAEHAPEVESAIRDALAASRTTTA